MKKRDECLGKNETRKDVRRRGGGGNKRLSFNSTL